jgi:DNA processing protein
MPHLLSGNCTVASQWIGYTQFLLKLGDEATGLARQFTSPDQVLRGPRTPSMDEWRRAILRCDAGNVGLPPGSWVQTISDEDYPPLLAECSDAPFLLFGRGDVETLSKPAIAIVGSRRPSLDGCVLAERFAYELASVGFVIVSGLATGIDTAAHRGAIKAGGKTVAVIATGIDKTYPLSNSSLSAEIVNSGAVVSQFPPASAPKKHHFPRRNRTLSGLALATVVIEAGIPSGTLITATAAAEQGRDVFALPWSINHHGGRGCLQLLMDGALLAVTPSDVVRAVNWFRPSIGIPELDVTDCSAMQGRAAHGTSDALVAVVGDGLHSADELASALAMDITEVQRALIQLEIDGRLTRLAHGYWTRTPI